MPSFKTIEEAQLFKSIVDAALNEAGYSIYCVVRPSRKEPGNHYVAWEGGSLQIRLNGTPPEIIYKAIQLASLKIDFFLGCYDCWYDPTIATDDCTHMI